MPSRLHVDRAGNVPYKCWPSPRPGLCGSKTASSIKSQSHCDGEVRISVGEHVPPGKVLANSPPLYADGDDELTVVVRQVIVIHPQI